MLIVSEIRKRNDMKNRFENLQEAIEEARKQSIGDYRAVIKSYSHKLNKFAYYIDENGFIQVDEILMAEFENGERI